MKRGVSTIVASVLIILITIAAVSLMWFALHPLINQIFFVEDPTVQIKIERGQYTYYDPDNNLLSLRVTRAADSSNISALNFIITTKDGNTHAHKSTNTITSNSAKVYNFNVETISSETNPVEKAGIAPIYYFEGKERESSQLFTLDKIPKKGVTELPSNIIWFEGCTPKTCSDFTGQCGTFSDGCGDNIDCSCSGGETCESGICQCATYSCTAQDDRSCGFNDGCGGTCDVCSEGTCVAGYCRWAETRNMLNQPFTYDSIWNKPIGSNAQYINAELPVYKYFGGDKNVIVLTPTAPEREVWNNGAGWCGDEFDPACDRCAEDISAGFSVPIPDSFVISNERPATPSYPGSFLFPDGVTISQFSPVTRCTPGGHVTYTDYAGYDNSVRLDEFGIEGSYGGSGLSSIGGVIRVGELTSPIDVRIRHSLKITLQAETSISNSLGGYRWPADRADWCHDTCYLGSVPELRMGALLALEPDFDESTLETLPAQKIAWTLKNYGAYLVGNSAWNFSAFAIEYGPNGDVFSEFVDEYGYTMTGTDQAIWETDPNWNHNIIENSLTPWGRDMNRILTNLSVVNNNAEGSTGGGGNPLQPLAPEL